MATSVLLDDDTKVAALTATRVRLDGGKVRLLDEFGSTLVDIDLDNPAGTFTAVTLEITVPVTGVAVLGGVAVEAFLLTSADAVVLGPLPVILKDSAELDGGAAYAAAVAAGDVHVYLVDSTTIVAGAVVTLEALPHVMLDPVP